MGYNNIDCLWYISYRITFNINSIKPIKKHKFLIKLQKKILNAIKII